jgi:hypothetical protein
MVLSFLGAETSLVAGTGCNAAELLSEAVKLPCAGVTCPIAGSLFIHVGTHCYNL